MYFLLTCDTGDKRFIETLIDPHKIVTIRLVEANSEFRMVIEDVNGNNFVSRFSTEYALRERLKQLLMLLATPISMAETMNITKEPDISNMAREELSKKLDELIKKL